MTDECPVCHRKGCEVIKRMQEAVRSMTSRNRFNIDKRAEVQATRDRYENGECDQPESETPQQEIERVRESAGRTIGALREEARVLEIQRNHLREALSMILPLAERYLANAPTHPDNGKLQHARDVLIESVR